MAVSATINDQTVWGDKRVTFTSVTFDNSYPTGGEPITAAQLGLSRVDFALCNIKAVGGTVNVANAYFDQANMKIKIYDETPAEAGNTSDYSTLTVVVMAVGK